MKKKRPLILWVMKRGTKWIFKSSRCINGWTLYDEAKTKAECIEITFKYAKKLRPARVKIYSAKGKLQVQSDW